MTVKPKSLIVDVYGTYVRYRGGEIGLQQLIELGKIFGINEQSMRMTVSRLKKENWLQARRVHRHAYYAITPRSARLLEEGRRRIFTRNVEDWSGQWYMVIYNVPESARKERERLRQVLVWLGFGMLAPSTWISVADRFDELKAVLDEDPYRANIEMLTVRSEGVERDREFAARCWNLEEVGAKYQQFIERQDPINLDQMSPESAFIARVELVHDYRRFVHVDPDLPPALLPPNWPGQEAHRLFLDRYRSLERLANEYFDRVFVPPPPIDEDAPDREEVAASLGDAGTMHA